MRTFEEIKKEIEEHEKRIGCIDFDDFLKREKELEEEMNEVLDAELGEDDL